MKLLSNIVTLIVMLLMTNVGFAQIKNVKTATFNISGNCNMCKSTIEKAGTLKDIAQVQWNKDTKIATISYNQEKTNADEILKRIALAGYDNEKFLAPAVAYSKLPECCLYERTLMQQDKRENAKLNTEHAVHANSSHHSAHSGQKHELDGVFNHYFLMKDALVNTDSKTSSLQSEEFLKAISAVDISKLSHEEHTVWTNVISELSSKSKAISSVKEIEKQRAHFELLSMNMYQLAKVSNISTPIFHQRCPMYNDGKGGNWLSREERVKNPYYGSKMLTCGSVIEIIN